MEWAGCWTGCFVTCVFEQAATAFCAPWSWPSSWSCRTQTRGPLQHPRPAATWPRSWRSTTGPRWRSRLPCPPSPCPRSLSVLSLPVRRLCPTAAAAAAAAAAATTLSRRGPVTPRTGPTFWAGDPTLSPDIATSPPRHPRSAAWWRGTRPPRPPPSLHLPLRPAADAAWRAGWESRAWCRRRSPRCCPCRPSARAPCTLGRGLPRRAPHCLPPPWCRPPLAWPPSASPSPWARRWPLTPPSWTWALARPVPMFSPTMPAVGWALTAGRSCGLLPRWLWYGFALLVSPGRRAEERKMSRAEAQAGIVLVLPFTRVGSVSLILLKNNPATVSHSAFWSLSHWWGVFVSGRGKCPEWQREKLLVKEWFTWFNYLLWRLLVFKVCFSTSSMFWQGQVVPISRDVLVQKNWFTFWHWSVNIDRDNLYMHSSRRIVCKHCSFFSSFPSVSNPRHFGCAQLWSAVRIFQTVVPRRLCLSGYVVAACRMSCGKWTYSAIKSQFSPFGLSSSLMLALPFARQFPSHNWVTVKRWQRHLLNVIHGGWMRLRNGAQGRMCLKYWELRDGAGGRTCL